jgi:hypothetical protein
MRLEYYQISPGTVLDTVVLDEPPANDVTPIVYDTGVAQSVVDSIMNNTNLSSMGKRRALASWTDGTYAMRRI